jgi:hypothetical protein
MSGLLLGLLALAVGFGVGRCWERWAMSSAPFAVLGRVGEHKWQVISAIRAQRQIAEERMRRASEER